jgi:hypothetical protein
VDDPQSPKTKPLYLVLQRSSCDDPVPALRVFGDACSL